MATTKFELARAELRDEAVLLVAALTAKVTAITMDKHFDQDEIRAELDFCAREMSQLILRSTNKIVMAWEQTARSAAKHDGQKGGE
jgi:hypothetical protein